MCDFNTCGGLSACGMLNCRCCLLQNLELGIDCDSRIALVGPNGAGATYHRSPLPHVSTFNVLASLYSYLTNTGLARRQVDAAQANGGRPDADHWGSEEAQPSK